MKNEKLKMLEANRDFIDFYCFKEDKWLQNADFEEKLVAVFGSIEQAETEFNEFKKENLIDESIE
ncbi:MAG: hypothetical protein H3C45_03130 [Bacteroidia bacterium]|nr:hypothetical protein [Bacteroidia bacterium]